MGESYLGRGIYPAALPVIEAQPSQSHTCFRIFQEAQVRRDGKVWAGPESEIFDAGADR